MAFARGARERKQNHLICNLCQEIDNGKRLPKAVNLSAQVFRHLKAFQAVPIRNALYLIVNTRLKPVCESSCGRRFWFLYCCIHIRPSPRSVTGSIGEGPYLEATNSCVIVGSSYYSVCYQCS
jgi:hypothetical protein